MHSIRLKNIDDTISFANRLGSLVKSGMLITMSGDLGAGKTTMTKAIGKALGIKRTINSPTFTILKSYHGDINLHHIDAYRLEGTNQDLGFEEVFEDESAICIVEWPQFIEDYLPSDRLEIVFNIDGEDRIITIEGKGKIYKDLEEQL